MKMMMRGLAGFGLVVLAWGAWVYVTTWIERARQDPKRIQDGAWMIP